MNNNFYVTQKEYEIIEKRSEEVLRYVQGEGNMSEQLCRYAEENGYNAEEAHRLVDVEVIPTVDEYNAACREHIDKDIEPWIQDRISECTEGMTLEEECRYKLGILAALRGISAEILAKVCTESREEMKSEYEGLNLEDVTGHLAQGEYTPELLEQIDRELVFAIENSGLEWEMASRFEELANGKADDESVHGFVMEMWQDGQYKYCAAVAACVARRNKELPSVPDDIPERALVIGVCQGIDVANLETQVALGSMTAERAYKILKLIVAVGAILLVNAVLFLVGLAVAGAVFSGIVHLFGNGLLACVLGVSLGATTFFVLTGDACEIIEGAKNTTYKIYDFTYGKLKKGAAAVCDAVHMHVVPCLQGMLDSIHTFIGKLAMRFRGARSYVKVRV